MGIDSERQIQARIFCPSANNVRCPWLDSIRLEKKESRGQKKREKKCPLPCLYASLSREASDFSGAPVLLSEFCGLATGHNFYKKTKISVAAAGIARYDTGGSKMLRQILQPCGLSSDYKAAGVLRQNVWGGKRFTVKQNFPLFTS